MGNGEWGMVECAMRQARAGNREPGAGMLAVARGSATGSRLPAPVPRSPQLNAKPLV